MQDMPALRLSRVPQMPAEVYSHECRYLVSVGSCNFRPRFEIVAHDNFQRNCFVIRILGLSRGESNDVLSSRGLLAES